MKDRCKLCKNYQPDPDPESPSSGECRRWPPDQSDKMLFPVVSGEHDWCGEFVATNYRWHNLSEIMIILLAVLGAICVIGTGVVALRVFLEAGVR